MLSLDMGEVLKEYYNADFKSSGLSICDLLEAAGGLDLNHAEEERADEEKSEMWVLQVR